MKLGSEVQLGNYRGEKIIFTVEDVSDGVMLLVSKYVIISRIFDRSTNQWQESKLRKWLNNNFYNSVFNNEEKKKILTNDSGDFIFVLNSEECTKIFKTTDCRKKQIAKNADARRLYLENNYCSYWLRSEFGDYIECVDNDGEFAHSWPYNSKNGVVIALYFKGD